MAGAAVATGRRAAGHTTAHSAAERPWAASGAVKVSLHAATDDTIQIIISASIVLWRGPPF